VSLPTDTPGPDARVTWPAVVCIEGDDELVYIGSAQQWAGALDLLDRRCTRGDYLVDSDGRKFGLVTGDDGQPLPVFLGEEVSLQSFTGLLRAHAAVAGQCCIEKIVTASVADGIALVKSLGAG